MKKGVLGLLLLFNFSYLPSLAAAPLKPGSSCSKQGITKTYKGKKYTCTKSGRKLVWNKGVVVQKPIPNLSPSPMLSLSPSPSASPSPYPSSVASSSPSPSLSPTSIPSPLRSQSAERQTTNGEKAANEIFQQFSKSDKKSEQLLVFYSPTINRDSEIVKQNIDDSYKSIAYWESLGVTFSKKIALVFVTEEDQVCWREFKPKLGSSEHDLDKSTFANYLTQPFMGYAGIGKRSDEVLAPLHILLFLGSNLETQANLYWAKTMAPHEFAHLVQFILVEENGAYDKFEKSACWFIEGLARFYERATQYSSLYEGKFTYEEMKARQLTYFDYIIPRETSYGNVKDWTPKTYLEFLIETQDRNKTDVCRKTGYGYSIGWPIAEKFYIDFGPKAYVALLQGLKQTNEWNSAFRLVTGIDHRIWLEEKAIPHLMGKSN
jgi:hypothetical protein